MDIDGTHGRGETTPAVPPLPRPAAPPPMPQGPPAAPLEAWLRTPRHSDAPGIYAFGHTPRPPQDPDRISDRKLLGGAVLSLLCGLLVWSLCWDGYLPFVFLAVYLDHAEFVVDGRWQPVPRGGSSA